MSSYPDSLVPPGGTAPVPRRLRGQLAGAWVFDTEDAVYVWEIPPYPQYYVPVADLDPDVLIDEQHTSPTRRGTAARWGLRVRDVTRPGSVKVYGEDASPDALRQLARIDFAALDAWFEEDERIYVHPRNPYSRVDALRANRSVRIEVDGVVLADAPAAMIVFETGLPPRYYLDPATLRHEHLRPSDTVTACPYKGTTSQYWSAEVAGTRHEDLAWCYGFPTRELQPIAGLVAFYNERVDTFVDGREVPRPTTPFS